MLCRSIEIGVAQLVSNHHEIDVAVGCIGFLRNRSVDEGGLDPVGVWLEGFFDGLGQANGLLNESSQLIVNSFPEILFETSETIPAEALFREYREAPGPHPLT